MTKVNWKAVQAAAYVLILLALWAFIASLPSPN
jgi:hypothetical protein